MLICHDISEQNQLNHPLRYDFVPQSIKNSCIAMPTFRNEIGKDGSPDKKIKIKPGLTSD